MNKIAKLSRREREELFLATAHDIKLPEAMAEKLRGNHGHPAADGSGDQCAWLIDGWSIRASKGAAEWYI